MADLECRLAEPRDVPALVELVNRAYEVEAFFVTGDRTDAAEIADLRVAGEFFVIDRDANDGGAGLLGCVYLAPRPGGRAYLGLLSVDPAAQKSGAGKRLVAFAEARAGELGAQVIELHVVDA